MDTFCASVLLDDLDEAIRTYSALNEWGRGNIDGYPIKALYDRAMKEMVKPELFMSIHQRTKRCLNC